MKDKSDFVKDIVIVFMLFNIGANFLQIMNLNDRLKLVEKEVISLTTPLDIDP